MKRQRTKSTKKSKNSPQIDAPAVNTSSSIMIFDSPCSRNAQTAITKKDKRKFDLQSWLIQKIRRISYQYPARKEAIKKGRVSRGKYRCAICHGENFGPKEIQLDHIEPVINPHEGFENWDVYIKRLFVDIDGWQILCHKCHQTKSQFENNIRKQVKKEKNNDPEDDI